MSCNADESDPLDCESQSRVPAGAKIVYMIRHGQSEGQVATRSERKRSTSLRDCDLTRRGREEAEAVSRTLTQDEYESIELVVSSPLTRALHTALRAFPNKDIIVDYSLREIGSRIPENSPRSMHMVMRDLVVPLSHRSGNGGVLLDIASRQPEDWPNPALVKKGTKSERFSSVLKWLAEERPESTIAVVCHYNVIREAVKDGRSLRPVNAVPIRCYLYPNGKLVLHGSKETA